MRAYGPNLIGEAGNPLSGEMRGGCLLLCESEMDSKEKLSSISWAVRIRSCIEALRCSQGCTFGGGGSRMMFA